MTAKVVLKATARQYNFASILSALGKFVKCQLWGGQIDSQKYKRK